MALPSSQPHRCLRRASLRDGPRAGAKGLTKQVTVRRIDQRTGPVYYRHSRRRKRLSGQNRGFLAISDGRAFASQLAHYFANAQPGRSTV